MGCCGGGRRGEQHPAPKAGSAQETTLKFLQQRLAKGEISPEQYKKLKILLDDSNM